ncbi:hypothetical protein [Mucilaginibacter sp. OK098]|uniref:hypothetical protein n=1 Tax=Mucilaginibacter sp. OK098 TaxID=1855297 RepID=UPI000934C005|nr:hypothetical protein [Mucilaginibacter sp. OK098]
MKRLLNLIPSPTSKRLIIYCVSFIAVFFVGIAVDLACSGEDDPYDYYVSFFHNNVQGEHNYGSFYLSYNYVFNDEEPESEQDINAKEWAAYLGRDIKTEDVKAALYGDAKGDSAMLHDKLIGKNKLPDGLKSNSFFYAIAFGNNDSALQYYLFAKGVERVANFGYDQWNPQPVDTNKLYNSGLEALKRAKTEKDKFIKLRYLYQAERLLHYSTDFKQAMAVYDEYIADYKSDSHVKGWALALKAGEERRLGDTGKAAYLFSKVFALYPERRVQAYKNFHYCSANADKVAALAANNTERAFIYAIDGFGNMEYNIPYLQKVYQYDPHAEAVGVLLVRELNKLELKYLSPRLGNQLTYNNSYKDPEAGKTNQEAINEINELQKVCNKLSADGKYAEPALGYIASAYLSWMEGGHTADGLNYLSKVNNEKLSPKLNDQKQLVNLLLTAQKFEKLNDVNEAQLLPSLKWLDNKVAEQLKKIKSGDDNGYARGYNSSRFASSARDFYNLVLSTAYLKQKDTIKAALCILKSEKIFNPVDSSANNNLNTINTSPQFWTHYLHSPQVNQLIAWKLNPTGSSYLKFLAGSLSKIKTNELYDLLGTDYLREHNYSMATAAFKKISIKGYNKGINMYIDSLEMADPFINQLHDYPKVFLNANSKPFNRLMFAQKMLSLQGKLKSDPKNAASYYFQIATGLYNATHYGNAYYLISYEWSSYDYGRQNLYSYDNDYIKTKTAEQYYLKAYQLSTDQEFKAKCTYMAAKCRQKQITAPDGIGWSGESNGQYDKAVRNNPYFAGLKSGYSKTAFYKLAVNECSYLRDYLASAKNKK